MQQIDRKIHVVFDMTFPRRLKTGTTVYANELVAALRERGSCQITCVAERIPVHHGGAWRIWNGIRSLIWTQLLLPLKLLLLRADVLHAPSYFAPLLCPCPLVLTVHDVLFLTHPQHSRTNLFSIYGRLFIRRSIRRADVICTVSQASKREIELAYEVPSDRIRVTYLGVNPRFQPQPENVLAAIREKYGLSKPFFLFVGIWAPRKNIPGLIQAFRIYLETEHKDCELILVGPQDGGETGIQQLLADPELAKRVRPLAFAPDEDMPAIYAAADVLVMPSLGEGFGLPIVEAMASGTPVIASRVSCLPEVAGDAALYFDPEEPAGIARAMKLAASPEMHHRLREMGFKRAQIFTWDNAARDTEKAYADAIN
jgi:glycosyltransferase involved in cell wall biosynthesis